MALQKKYYKEIESHGHKWRLEIWQDTTATITAVEIGPVIQGLRLVMQGDQADIDTPIVKTSLEMVFVDAPDLEEDRKCGYWEEFYTSSATEYQVILYKEYMPIWVGYVTPDSFSENLSYRGSVTIIARDNLGHLQDFIFDLPGDANNMVSLLDIINGANNKEIPLLITPLTSDRHNKVTLKCDDGSNFDLSELQFNVSSFYGMSWWDVLEKTLYSTGMVLRYTGTKFMVFPIRYLGLGEKYMWADVPRKEVTFLANGHRDLSPAVKSVQDKIAFEIQEEIVDTSMNDESYGSVNNGFDFEYLGGQYYKIPTHATIGGVWNKKSASESLMLNPFAYPINSRYGFINGDIQDTKYIYVACNENYRAESREAIFTKRLVPGTYSIRLVWDRIIAFYNDMSELGYIDYDNAAIRCNIAVYFVGDDGVTYRYVRSDTGNVLVNEWQKLENVVSSYYTSISVLSRWASYPLDFSTPDLEVTTSGVLTIGLQSPTIAYGQSNGSIAQGGYAGMQVEVKATALNNSICQSIRVTTNYNNNNNVVLNRQADFGINTSNIDYPLMVKNAMYVVDNSNKLIGSDRWYWHNTDTRKPLAVLIHQQLLAHYSKPNNVLSGELIDKKNDDVDLNALYTWNGKEHILLSGTHNILTGRIENAVLREFVRYDRLWEVWSVIESYSISYAQQTIYVQLRNIESFSTADLKLPSWMSYVAHGLSVSNKTCDLTLRCMQNSNSASRSAVVQIGTVFINVKQAVASVD